MVKRHMQTQLERKRTGREEWLVVTRRLLSDESILEGKSSPDAAEHDGQYRYRYYLTPTSVPGAEIKAPSLGELARVIKAGNYIEASFKRGKGDAGIDEYQVRTCVEVTTRHTVGLHEAHDPPRFQRAEFAARARYTTPR
jgi:hypothetical protein